MVRVGRAIAGAVIGVVVLVALGYAAFFLSFGASNHAEFTISADRVPQEQIAADATTSLTAREATVVEEAIVNGSAQTVVTRLDLDGAYVIDNGSYYRVSVTDSDNVARERFVVEFRQVNVNEESVRDADSLPSVDRHQITGAYRETQIGDGHEVMTYPYRDQSEANDSELVTGNVSHIRMQNVTLRVNVTRRNVTLNAYRYATSRVASNESTFVRSLVQDVDGALPDGETGPIETSIANDEFTSRAGDYESAWDPVAPIAAMCGIDADTFMNRNETATCYVRFEGTHYRLTFDGHHSFV